MRKNITVKTILAVFTSLMLATVTPHSSAQSPVSSSAAQALYQRLGGYDAIAAVTDDFLGRLAVDKQMSRFFVGVSADSLRKLRQHVVDQLCEASGGPCYYFGRTMKTAHAGLGITESDWQLTVKHLTATFDKFKVPDRERSEVVALLSSPKADIVEKP